jgi:hypothetical protein
MTIIVYRDGVMAADTAEWTGHYEKGYVIVGHVNKIHRLKDGSLLGCSGRTSDIQAVKAWLEHGSNPESRPAIDKNIGFNAILATLDVGVFKIEDDCRPFLVESPYHVVGTPDHFCLGALAAGASAEEAVTLAIQFHEGAAGEVRVERLVQKAFNR